MDDMEETNFDYILWWVHDDDSSRINDLLCFTHRVDATIVRLFGEPLSPYNPLATLRWLLSQDLKMEHEFIRHTPAPGSTMATEISRGATCTVFEGLGSGLIIKKLHSPFQDLYYGEYVNGLKVYEQFSCWRTRFPRTEDVPLVPRPLEYYHFGDDTGALWDMKCKSTFRYAGLASPDHVPATDTISVEQITPLCKPIRRALWKLYGQGVGAPMHEFEDVKPCIARVILQRVWNVGHPEPLTLGNCKLFVDQLADINPKALTQFAREMGAGLAALNWEAYLDGKGVKFFLGGWPTVENFSWNCYAIASMQAPPSMMIPSFSSHMYPKRPVHLWMTGFKQCGNIKLDEDGLRNGFKRACEVMMTNESFPGYWYQQRDSPFHQYWHDFYNAYRAVTKDIWEMIYADLFKELLQTMRCPCRGDDDDDESECAVSSGNEIERDQSMEEASEGEGLESQAGQIEELEV